MHNKLLLSRILKRNLFFRSLFTQKTKYTFVLRHVIMPERIKGNALQQNPNEKQNFQKYELVENEDMKAVGTIKLILLEDVEGTGLQFDVVDVTRDLAHNFLLPTQKAAYASPFDLDYYAKKKEIMKEELENRIRIPYKLLNIGRYLMHAVIPIFVSMDNPWTINKEIIMASMLEANINFTKSPKIYLPEKSSLSGPNFDLEASLIRFYILINNQYIVPILGRIMHISSDNSKQNLYPAISKLPTKEQLKKFEINIEEPYYQSKPFDEGYDVIKFLENLKKR